MIPNSQDRSSLAEYEYQRRKFLKLRRGRVYAWFSLLLSFFLIVLCIVLNRVFKFFSFGLVCGMFWIPCWYIVFFASWLFAGYSLQVLITVWKELNNQDTYTPFMTNNTLPPALDSSSFFSNCVKERNLQDDSTSEVSATSDHPSFSWK